jgi:SSS family solute:Na+ symporter
MDIGRRNMSGPDVGIIVAYFLLIISIGFFASRRAKSSDDYLVAGRRLGFGMSFACLCAVLLGGASTMGTAKLGYLYGISGIWLVAMLGLGLTLVGILLVRRIHGLRITTIAELLKNRFGASAGVISAAISALYTMMVCATQVIAMGTILQILLGWDPVFSMVIVGGIVVVYTILGGMWAITLTDFIQFLLIAAGILLVMLPLCLMAVGGFETLSAKLEPSYFDLTSIGWPTIVQFFFLYCLGGLVGQDVWQRFLAARSVKISRNSGIAAGVFCLIYALACAVIGMCAAVYMPGLEDPQLAFVSMASAILPQGLLGFVLAAVLAVLMSTASGTLLASASLITHGIVGPLLKRGTKTSQESDRRLLLASRVTSAAVGVFAIAVAAILNDIIAALNVSYAILTGALFLPIILGIFWKRVTARAAIISMAASSLVVLGGLYVKGIASVEPIVWGIAVSAILIVGITFVEKH